MKKTYKIDVDCANCANKMEAAAQMKVKLTVDVHSGKTWLDAK